uniref:Uncharacterized protein n=1 Tax=Anguilla anguilla TaxID=7936 RepID=A0A0E9SYG2_ANGAN
MPIFTIYFFCNISCLRMFFFNMQCMHSQYSFSKLFFFFTVTCAK